MEFLIKITEKLRSFTDFVEIKQTQENGVVVSEFRMTLANLINVLSTSGIEGKRAETPFLPKNCIKMISTMDGYQVFIELEKRKWNIVYNNQKLLVGFPRLLLVYYISKNHVRNFKLFAIKDKSAITADTELYYFPFSNVYHESGDVCMGMNQFPEVTNLTQLEKLHYLFFAAPFSGDYGSISVKGKSLETLFKESTDQNFNDEDLLPYQRTLHEFFGLED